MCELSIAVDRPTRRDDKPDWFNLKIWEESIEAIENLIETIKKGDLIAVQGQLHIEAWKDRNTGFPQSKLVIQVEVEAIELIEKKKNNQSDVDLDESEF